MTTPVRVPAAEATQTPAERTSESRRRADRARSRSAERAPVSETEGAPAGLSRVSYSVARIPVTRPSDAEAAEAPRPQAQQGQAAGAPQQQPAAEAAPLGEGFQVPPAPEPGITAEQVAAREQQTAAAQAALDSAQATPALMDAFAAAPPTVKAQVSGDLGARLSGTMAKETQAIQESTPDIKAEMNGNMPPPAGTIIAPTSADVNLEPVPPEPTPDAESILGGPVLNERGVNANPGVTERVQSSLSGATDIWAMAERVAEQSLDNVQTRDPNVVTSPGTPPRVPQSGETDPQRFQNQIDEGSRQARDVLTQQQDQARALPGAERVQLADVHESIPLGELTAPTAEQAAAPEGAQQYLAMNQPPEVQTAFDELAGGPMQDSLAEAQSQMQTAAQERDTQHQEAVNKAQQDAAEAQRQADSDQRTRVAEARSKIEDGRQSTLQQQEAAVADVEQQAEDRRNTDRGEFDRQASDKQAEIDGKYQQAEVDANAQVAEGERQAEEERRKKEREAEDESWLDAALDFLTDLFDALVDFINSVFDWVREQINNILTALRDAVIGLIDAIASALKSLIHAFADFLKGLVQDLLGDLFPELAAKLCALIDEAVAAADRAIDSVANALKTAVNAIVETLRAGINFVINTFQAAVNTGLALARAALTGDWATFFLQLFESACRVAGIDPASIYEFIGRQRETIQIIVDDPGGFVSNIFSAVWGGITRFADNFLTHLQNSIIDWLTGTIGSTGITLPEHFDLLGVISIVAQVLGLTWANLRIRIVRFVGERGVQVLEFVVSYVQTLIEGGWQALWERIQNDLSTLRDTLLGMLVDYIKERIIVAAVTRLATLFNPVGALVNLIIAAYQFYTFIRDQMQRIVRVLRVVADMIGNIARGILEPAIAAVEGVLAELLTLAIDLLARFLNLGNVGARVREIIQNIQDAVWRAIDRFLEFVLSLFRGGSAEGQLVAAAPGAAGAEEAVQIGERVPVDVPGGASHSLFIRVVGNDAVPYVASTETVLQQFLMTPAVDALRAITDEHGDVYVDTARRQAAVVNVEADQVLALARREPGQQRISAENAEVTREEQELVVSLRWIFRKLELSGAAISLSRDVVLDSINTQDRRVDQLLEIVAFDPEPLSSQLANLRTARTRLERMRTDAGVQGASRQQLQQVQNDVNDIRVEVDGYENDPGIRDNRARLDALRRNLQTEALSNRQWAQITAKIAEILGGFRADIMAVVPATRIGFRGSLARGWKGPQKVTPAGAAQRFDPGDFDCDAYIEVPLSLWMQEIEPILPVSDQGQTHKFRTLDEIRAWSRASQIAAIEDRIITEIQSVGELLRGFRIDVDTGRPAFHFFIQSPDATLDLQLQAAGYPQGAFRQAGAGGIEILLRVRGGVLRYPQTVVEV